MRSGKRARPLSPLQPSSHFPASAAADARFLGGASFGSFSQQPQHQRAQREAEDGELAALQQEVRPAVVLGSASRLIGIRGSRRLYRASF